MGVRKYVFAACEWQALQCPVEGDAHVGHGAGYDVQAFRHGNQLVEIEVSIGKILYGQRCCGIGCGSRR